MKKDAILHIPLSQYAHGLDCNTIVIRLRAARDDLRYCTLYYGDRACRSNPVTFCTMSMERVASTDLFDYFEVELRSPYTRVCYYFELDDDSQTLLYYADQFATTLPTERSEYYQLPFNHPADLATPPAWLYDAVVYNIFPDSFASRKGGLDGGRTTEVGGYSCKSHHGGTLRGVIQNLDYIKSMGFTCVYLNPIFTAGEYHKYDIMDYKSIDPCFGSNADFAELVSCCHAVDMQVIIDGVFNHCSWNFFAFDDVVRNGIQSAYYDWFYHLDLPVHKPQTGEELPRYDCFAYERMMPKLNTANPQVQQYFCDVGQYWVGQYGIDGWRLDVANEVDSGFWRAFRQAVHHVNPACVLVGEIWESAGYWLAGDMFDSAMNYSLRVACRDFFACSTDDALAFDSRVTEMRMRYRKQVTGVQLNLLDSHDVPRFLSLCDGSPDRMKLAVLFQMLFEGVPSVFYGDELGVEGVTEEEYRKPMPWGSSHPLQDFYCAIIALRNNSTAVRHGQYRTLHAASDSGLYCFTRFDASERLIVVMNAGGKAVMPAGLLSDTAQLLLGDDVRHGYVCQWGYAVYRE